MAFPRILTADGAAALIPDGAVVTVSSSSGLGCPDAVLAAIGRRFDASGHPRAITTLHPIAAGDMYGVKGIDHIASAVRHAPRGSGKAARCDYPNRTRYLCRLRSRGMRHEPARAGEPVVSRIEFTGDT